MEEPQVGIKNLLQGSCPGQLGHDLRLDGSLICHRGCILRARQRDGFGGQIGAAYGVINALPGKGFEQASRIPND